MATLDEQFISVQIVRLLPFGLLVRLPDGNQGLIREREIGWDRQSRHNWQRRFKPGDTCQALPLGIGLDDRLELSLRLAEHDPWHMLDVRYPVGHLVQGTVTSVQSYGVFVELEPGVSGLLHNSRLPAHLQGQPVEDLFWAGDVVKVLVERIEPRSRQISFNLSRALLQRWPRGQLPARTDEASATLSDTVSHSDADSPPTLRWRILVVEDDSAQRQALARWLEQEGHQVRAAESAEAAFLLLEEMTPDLVLTDFGLPQQNGLTVLRHVRKRWPSLRCALMTDWTRISEHGDEIAHWHRQGVHLLLKPLQPADVEALLVAQPEAPEALPELTEPLEQQRPALPHLLHTNGFRPQFLHDLLAQACSATGAAKAVLFALEPTRRAVRILAEVGVAPLNDEAISGLLHSPVRDVAEDQPLLRIDDSQQAEARLRYLTPLLSFRSCLGLRLPTHLKERHALFLFSPQPHAFNASHELHTSATALAAGAWLERAAFQQQALEVQRLALLGQMSRGLVHEINHQLSPINFILHSLKRQVERTGQAAESPVAVRERELANISGLVQELAEAIDDITSTARTFGSVTIQRQEQDVDLADMVSDIVRLLRDSADRAHIELQTCIAPELPPVQVQPTQLEQILLNVVLNAIQQVSLHRPEGGRVVISAGVETGEQHPFARILVEDDGPGIHHRLWETIFELGFTTRKDGGSGGLGLYISRSLAESFGGQIKVQWSCVGWGSTVAINIPLATA